MEEDYTAVNHYFENAILIARLSLKERDVSTAERGRIKLIEQLQEIPTNWKGLDQYICYLKESKWDSLESVNESDRKFGELIPECLSQTKNLKSAVNALDWTVSR